MTVVPVLRVSSRATLNQWVLAFGLEPVLVMGEGDVVDHAELRLGDGWIMAGTMKDNAFDAALGGTVTYWSLPDAAAVDALHVRAVAAGAESLMEPYAPVYGGRECSLRDADGNVWSFGTYAPSHAA